MRSTIIQRGSAEDWATMLAYYGRDLVQQVPLNTPYLSDAAIAAVGQIFGSDKHQLRSYQRKQSILPMFNFWL